ncbi:Cryptococcal mannosyltransferase 1 [Tulasnella sp. 427]|nr:Cryptococcal mannosyltransferase 1 [Tulasnella sp. 427]
MAITLSFTQRRLLTRIGLGIGAIIILRALFGPSSHPKHVIREHNVLERVTLADKTLDVQRHPFLQARMGRDDRDDLLSGWVKNGLRDYWERMQLPFITSPETSHMDTQVVRSAIDDLLSLNGWVAAACPTLNRPFGQNKREDAYDELIAANHLYYVALVIHSADHFLVDQLAVIVQLARRLGHRNIFVSMLDYDSQDATPTLIDLCEAVLTLLQVPFRIRRVPSMTQDPGAAYYPLEESHMRNLALEPLHELWTKRSMKFHRVIWLKGFTCPNDILETIKVSEMNEAAMLALDLFGPDKEDDSPESLKSGGKYVLEDWDGAPDSFVCQEQKQTGGRKAIKTQRRLGFSVNDELAKLNEAQSGKR